MSAIEANTYKEQAVRSAAESATSVVEANKHKEQAVRSAATSATSVVEANKHKEQAAMSAIEANRIKNEMEKTKKQSIEEINKILESIKLSNQHSQHDHELIENLNLDIKKIKEKMKNIEGSNEELNKKINDLINDLKKFNNIYDNEINQIFAILNNLQMQIDKIREKPKQNPKRGQKPESNSNSTLSQSEKFLTKGSRNLRQNITSQTSIADPLLAKATQYNSPLRQQKGGSIYKILAKLSNKTKL